MLISALFKSLHSTCPLHSLFGSSLSTSPLSFSYHILCCLESHIITDQKNVNGHAITFKMPHHISLQHTTPSHTTPQHTTVHTYLRLVPVTESPCGLQRLDGDCQGALHGYLRRHSSYPHTVVISKKAYGFMTPRERGN